jgi:cbb3-type cytochrome oxidase subunit 1
MPRLTRLFIKIGLIYFIVALAMGLLMSAQPLLGLPPFFGTLRPVQLHLLMVGWVTQLIIGVVYWMFPKESRERPRGSETLAWSVLWLLNAGLIIRTIFEPLIVARPDLNAGWMLALSALLQVAAGWAFVFNTWRRVKER